jgi:hypothetical protein
MMCCPSSVSKACSQLWVYWPETLYICTPRWNDSRDQILVRSNWLGHQGAKTENTKSATTPELMVGSSPNCYHLVRIHDIIPRFLIWPTFQGHTEVKVCLGPLAFCNHWGYWPETLYICTPRSPDLTDQISVRSNSWLGHQGAKAENTKSAITQLMAKSPNFYHRYI